MDLSDATTNYMIGLSTEEVAQAVEMYGRNEIPVPVSPLYKLFLKQFTGFLPFLIEIACLVSLVIQDFTDFGIIAGILFVNGMLGFREEYHAKKALDEISNTVVSEVRVRRNGEVISIPAAELVPGDICMLVGGNIVPADMKWKHGDPLKIDTAALTGESLPRTYPSEEYGAEIFLELPSPLVRHTVLLLQLDFPLKLERLKQMFSKIKPFELFLCFSIRL